MVKGVLTKKTKVLEGTLTQRIVMFLNKTVHNGIPLLLFLNMRTTLINFTFKR